MKAFLSDIAYSPLLNVFLSAEAHPFGNKYHTFFYAKIEVLAQIELVQGKDHPKELPNP